MMEPMHMVTEMLAAFGKSMTTAIEHVANGIENIRYGKPGTIVFDYEGLPVSIPEPRDVMLVEAAHDAAARWIARTHFETLVPRTVRPLAADLDEDAD